MATTKNFTARFDLVGNLQSKFPAVKKMIDGFTNTEHKINFSMNDAEVTKKAQDMSTKLTSFSTSIQRAVNQTTDATNKQSDAFKKTSDKGNEHVSLMDRLTNKYKNFTQSVGDLKDQLAGMFAVLAGGAVATYTWKNAEEGAQYSESVMSRLSKRIGTKKVDTNAINDFVNKAIGSGYTSTTDRLQLTNTMFAMGAKNTGQAIGAADALEKIFFKDKTMLQKDFGITSAEGLAKIATKEKIDLEYQDRMDYLFGAGFSKKSQASRIKALGKMGAGIDVNDLLDSKPLDTMINRIMGIGQTIGNEFRDPLNDVARVINKILGFLDTNPIAPKFLAAGIAVAAVAGGLFTIVGMMPYLKGAVDSVAGGFKLLNSTASLGKFAAGLMSPWGILIALAAIILIVAYRTGVLQKAWDKFSSSAIGTDIINGIKGVGDFVGTLIDKFSEWYEASGKDTILTYFFKLCEVLGYAWEYIDKIYSTMKAGGASPVLAGISAFGMLPMALAGGIFSAATGKSPDEVLEGISGYIMGLLNLARTKFQFFDKIHDTMKRVQSILDWLWQLWSNFWSWVQKAMPGAEKESARKKMEDQAKKEGVWFDEPSGKWIKNGNVVNPSEKLAKLQDEYNSLPGFAEGIADAVAKGLGGIGDTIASKITGAFPDFTSLTKAIETLSRVLEPWANRGALTAEKTSMEENKAAGITWDVPAQGYISTKTGVFLSENRDEAMKKAEQGYASGVTFTRGGRFSGRVHEYEELVSQSASKKGPGVIAKSIDALDAIMNGRSSGAFGAAGGDVHLHQENNFDFTGSTISKDVDVKALLVKIDSRVRKTAVEAVSDQIGKRR